MALPSSGPISIAQIAAELAAGQFNLGYYRGRQYWRGATPVTISNSPAMSEFYGLQLNPPYTFWPVGGWVNLRLTGDVQPATPTVSVIAATGRWNFNYGSNYAADAKIANFNIPCPGVNHLNFPGLNDAGGGLSLSDNALPSGAVMRLSIQQDNLAGVANLDWGIGAGLSGRVAEHSGLPNFCGGDLNDALNTWQFTPVTFAVYGACQAFSYWNAPNDWGFQIGAWFAFLTDTPQYNGMTVTLSRLS